MLGVLINFNVINANYLADNAVIFNGLNHVFGWNSHSKQNIDLVVGGTYNAQLGNLNTVDDADLFDMTVNDADINIGFLSSNF